MHGVHIRALQELLSHKTLAMPQRYSHLGQQQLQDAVKLLDGVFGEGRNWLGVSRKIKRKAGPFLTLPFL
jgi:hypothetical protein